MQPTTDLSPDDPLQALAVSQVASLLAIHENTARDLLRRGDLPSFRIGRRVLVRRADLRVWIDRRVGLDTPPAQERY